MELQNLAAVYEKKLNSYEPEEKDVLPADHEQVM